MRLWIFFAPKGIARMPVSSIRTACAFSRMLPPVFRRSTFSTPTVTSSRSTQPGWTK